MKKLWVMKHSDLAKGYKAILDSLPILKHKELKQNLESVRDSLLKEKPETCTEQYFSPIRKAFSVGSTKTLEMCLQCLKLFVSNGFIHGTSSWDEKNHQSSFIDEIVNMIETATRHNKYEMPTFVISTIETLLCSPHISVHQHHIKSLLISFLVSYTLIELVEDQQRALTIFRNSLAAPFGRFLKESMNRDDQISLQESIMSPLTPRSPIPEHEMYTPSPTLPMHPRLTSTGPIASERNNQSSSPTNDSPTDTFQGVEPSGDENSVEEKQQEQTNQPSAHQNELREKQMEISEPPKDETLEAEHSIIASEPKPLEEGVQIVELSEDRSSDTPMSPPNHMSLNTDTPSFSLVSRSPLPQSSTPGSDKEPTLLDDCCYILSTLCQLGKSANKDHEKYFQNLSVPIVGQDLLRCCEDFKLLCLTGTRHVLTTRADAFKHKQLMHVVKRDVVQLILHNLAHSHLQVFRFSLAITSQIIILYQLKCKDELSFILPILIKSAQLSEVDRSFLRTNASLPELKERTSIVELLTVTFKLDSFLPNLFFTFDCDIAQPNLFEQLILLICELTSAHALARPDQDHLPPFVMTQGEYTLQKLEIVGLRALNTIVQSLTQWASAHALHVVTNDPREAVAAPKETDIESETTFGATRKLRQRLERGIELFNKSFKKGIEFLTSNGICEHTPESLAQFIFENETLSRSQIGEFFGQAGEFYIETTRCYLSLFNFEGTFIDQALSKFLSTFRISGESQKIYRIIECFGDEYFEQNPGSFPNAECAFMIAYQCLILHSVAHTGMLAQLPKHVFVEQGQGQGVSDDYLREAYDRVITNEIKVFNDDDERTQAALADQKAKVKNKKQLEKKMKEEAEEQRKLHAQLMSERMNDLQKNQESNLTLGQSIVVENGNLAKVLASPSLVEQTKGIFDVCSIPLFESAFACLKATKTPEVVKLSLSIIKMLVHMAAMFDIPDQLDSFMWKLSTFISTFTNYQVEYKHVQTISLLFSFADTKLHDDDTSGDGNMLRHNFQYLVALSGDLHELYQIHCTQKEKEEELNSTLSRMKSLHKEDKPKDISKAEKEALTSTDETAPIAQSCFTTSLNGLQQAYTAKNAYSLFTTFNFSFGVIDSFYSNSINLNASSFVSFMNALCIFTERAVSSQMLRDDGLSPTNPSLTSNALHSSFTIALFFLSKLIDVCTNNNEIRPLGVWDRLWPSLSSHLLHIIVSLVCLDNTDPSSLQQKDNIETMVIAALRKIVLSMFSRHDLKCPMPIPFFLKKMREEEDEKDNEKEKEPTENEDKKKDDQTDDSTQRQSRYLLSRSATAIPSKKPDSLLPWADLMTTQLTRQPGVNITSRQSIFLRPFESLSTNHVSLNIRRLALQCIKQLVDTSSTKLLSGWHSVFTVLKQLANNNETIDTAFGILVNVIETKAHLFVPFGISSCVAALVAFIKNEHSIQITNSAILLLSYIIGVVGGDRDLNELPITKLSEKPDAKAARIAAHQPASPAEAELIACVKSHFGVFDYQHLVEFFYPVFVGFFEATTDKRLNVQKHSYTCLFDLFKKYSSRFPPEFLQFLWNGLIKPIIEDFRMTMMTLPAKTVARPRTTSDSVDTARGRQNTITASPMNDASPSTPQPKTETWLDAIFDPVIENLIEIVGTSYDALTEQMQPEMRQGSQLHPTTHPIADILDILCSYILLPNSTNEEGISHLTKLVITTSAKLKDTEWTSVIDQYTRLIESSIPIFFVPSKLPSTEPPSPQQPSPSPTAQSPSPTSPPSSSPEPQNKTPTTSKPKHLAPTPPAPVNDTFVKVNKKAVQRRSVLQTRLMGSLETVINHLQLHPPLESNVPRQSLTHFFLSLLTCIRYLTSYTQNFNRDLEVRTRMTIEGVDNTPDSGPSLFTLEATATLILLNTLYSLAYPSPQSNSEEAPNTTLPEELRSKAKDMLMNEIFTFLMSHIALQCAHSHLESLSIFGPALTLAVNSLDLQQWPSRITSYKSTLSDSFTSNDFKHLLYMSSVSSSNVRKEVTTLLTHHQLQNITDIPETDPKTIVHTQLREFDKAKKALEERDDGQPIIKLEDVKNGIISYKLVARMQELNVPPHAVICCLHTLHRLPQSELNNFAPLLFPILSILTDSSFADCRRYASLVMTKLVHNQPTIVPDPVFSHPFIQNSFVLQNGPFQVRDQYCLGVRPSLDGK
ncbi:putative Brefeldin A-inhibited guanine nucleotide-exchange protein 2 [Blattamonas nauphoetae]|uniref:Brefeldin A-inhibited guanine nucleotide-exchange protein 2 n=1 Tax=Blattamonas nauphoetae TaxID=2049346 RepID=A0ABQ9Y3G4_9EUKA|nr:putative Brefeldin A-inhibited guanine nucleotide-exchange protein 2 [Blattamonas nauphoetae]